MCCSRWIASYPSFLRHPVDVRPRPATGQGPVGGSIGEGPGRSNHDAGTFGIRIGLPSPHNVRLLQTGRVGHDDEKLAKADNALFRLGIQAFVIELGVTVADEIAQTGRCAHELGVVRGDETTRG